MRRFGNSAKRGQRGLPVEMEFDALMGNHRALLSFGVLFEKALGPIPGPVLGVILGKAQNHFNPCFLSQLWRLASVVW